MERLVEAEPHEEEIDDTPVDMLDDAEVQATDNDDIEVDMELMLVDGHRCG
ncbi:hypothetical protein [Caballeronia cordobensis]|uniref:hypothetical protein n=1 Tax=Caballeronia cordobensis TaxID=1353886 RepID=UPI000ADC01C2|nr:hypothetical protein [Caballeronia cordobensis]